MQGRSKARSMFSCFSRKTRTEDPPAMNTNIHSPISAALGQKEKFQIPLIFQEKILKASQSCQGSVKIYRVEMREKSLKVFSYEEKIVTDHTGLRIVRVHYANQSSHAKTQ